jgi:hypothetical protein
MGTHLSTGRRVADPRTGTNRSYFTVIPIFLLGLVLKTMGNAKNKERNTRKKLTVPQKQYFITFSALLFFAQTS